MKQLKSFGGFWYDFIVGDDWRVAVGVALALAVTFVLARSTTIALWWIVPAAVSVLLPMSIWRATRRTG